MGELTLRQIIGNFFDSYDNDFQIYYILKEKNNYSTYFVDMNKNIINGFSGRYRENLKPYLDVEIKDFDVIAGEDDVIEMVNNEEIAIHNDIKDLLNPINAYKATNPDFGIEKIIGYAVVMLNDNDEKLILYRKYLNPKAIKENSNLCFINGSVEILNHEFISIDSKIDAIEYKGKTYVINRYYFQQLFKYKEAYVKFINASLDSLKNEDAINNFDTFSERCLASGNLVRKLVKVVKEDRLKWLKTNIKSAQKVANEYRLKIEFDDSGEKIDFNSNCNISDVMKLICGCCVKDAVDMHKYIATSVKEVVNQ